MKMTLTSSLLSDICRLCLEEKEGLLKITKDIVTTIHLLTSVEIQTDNGFPDKVCNECLQQTHNYVKFKQQCEKSNHILENLFKKEKQESTLQLSTDENFFKCEVKEEIELENIETQRFTNNQFSNHQLTNETSADGDDECDESTHTFSNASFDNAELLDVNKSNNTSDECTSGDDIFNKIPPVITNSQFYNENILSQKDTLNGNRVKKAILLGPDKCDTSTLTCKICDKVLVSIHTLARHMELHEDNRKFNYICSVCNKGFYDRGNLTKHMSRHQGDIRYTCEMCHKGFYELSALAVHMRKHKVDPITCQICEKQFMVQLQLDIHMKTHSTEKEHTCEKCGKAFFQPHLLKKHQKSHIDARMYPCFLCDKEFKDDYSLKLHHRRCHTDTPKKVVCNVCGKAVGQYHIKTHMLLHSGVKQYKCTQCSSAYFRKYELTAHCKIKHKSHGEPRIYRHLCSICGKQCISPKDLKIHVRTHTGERPFHCDMCEKKYKTQWALQSHVRAAHMDERPHICDVCSKGFHTSRILRIHMRTHTGERPYVCQLCERAFTQKAALKTHMKIHSINLD